MKLKIEIDSDDLTVYTSAKEDTELAKEFIKFADDCTIIEEAINRDLITDILDELNTNDLEIVLRKFEYILKE